MVILQIRNCRQVGSEINLEIGSIRVQVHLGANVDIDLVPPLWLVVCLVGRRHLHKRQSLQTVIFIILDSDKEGIVAVIVHLKQAVNSASGISSIT